MNRLRGLVLRPSFSPSLELGRVDQSDCVETDRGSFLIDRYAIGTLMKVPRKRAAV